ncbi:DUF998 domain-containing protein [Cohnella caldifontis]|uniref:DUF998 domain-containing protein n=1 Tax=Cohnella caldifontis TaxID=3027471 RepID=UPI0023EA8FA7|nr:DUF998 domain-containing protein [Cohnella sp. YIM B05605]
MKTVVANRVFPQVTVSASTVTVAASGLFVALLALLHLLKPELTPSWRMVSEYAIGRYGGMMAAAFLVLSAGCAALFAAVRREVRTAAGRIGLALLLISAAAIAAAAFFTTDPVTATKSELTAHGNMHGLTSMIGIPSLTIASVLINLSLLRNPAWRANRFALAGSSAFVVISLLSMVAAVALTLPQHGGFGPGVYVGWPNRILMVAYCVWLFTVAWKAQQLKR